MSSDQERSYRPSDHCDGRKFFNPGGPPLPSLADVLRWQFTRRSVPWPQHVTVSERSLPAPLADPSSVSATWINHASFLLRSIDANILIDPIFSVACGPFGRFGPRRVHAPGISFETLPPIHLLLVSHDHYDHCDLPTLRRLAARDQPVTLTPLGNRALLERAGLTRIVELDWWESRTVVPHLQVTLTPSQHWSNRLSGPRCGRLWGGFSLLLRERRIQFVGDTGYHPRLFKSLAARLGPPELALIPIGAYEPRWFMQSQHCNPAEAVLIHQDLQARQSIAMHWGTFRLTDEGRDDPPKALREALRSTKLMESTFRILEPGETLVV